MSVIQRVSDGHYIGRFRVLRTLGRGAEGVVYLASDPKLGREVAVKTLSLGESPNPAHAELLLSTARTASTLSHPNIVPVFEAGMHEGNPFVVFEYVKGSSLAQLLASEGPMPMARAVIMMSQILAGVAQMHARGLIHGDIKPANILVGANDLARVADFGLMRHERAPPKDEAAGTVRFMAPECFDGGVVDCRVDVYALGLVFHEMLTGEPVFGRGTVHSQVYSTLNEIPQPPSAKNARIASEIDAIVLKALNKSPAQRYANAGEMKRELDRFRVPVATADRVELRDRVVHSTVDFLVRRMAHKSDFPALSASFARINQISSQADNASIKVLSDNVMRDFALTQKLLRLVNSAANGNRKVTKVSQAITILGVGQLRAVATAMMLANGANGKTTPAISAALTDAFVAGLISRNIGRMTGLAAVEELFICGMFSSLGELLAMYYLTDEHAEIARRIADERVTPDAAARAVLGLTFDELGSAIAQQWQFPPEIVAALAPLPPGVQSRAASPADRMWHCAAYARELCALARNSDSAARASALEAHIERFAQSIPADADKVRELMACSVEVTANYTAAAGLAVSKTAMLEGMSALCGANEHEAAVVSPPVVEIPGPEAAQTIAQSPPVAGAPVRSVAATPEANWRTRLTLAWRSLF